MPVATSIVAAARLSLRSCLTHMDRRRVLEQDGRDEKVRPFVRDELLKPLERYFFGHSAT